jgi:hypothetical protein
MPTKAWYEANRDALLERRRAHYQANKEMIKQKNRAHYHANKEAKSIQKKEYYQKHKEHLIAKNSAYYFANKEARKEINDLRHQRYREENKETVKQSKAKWREKNREQDNFRSKLWRQANPAKCRAYVRNRQAAQLQRTPKWLTAADFKAIEAFYWEAKSKEIETGVSHHVDHIIPLRGRTVSGLHVPSNLQVIRAEDNVRKGNRYGAEISIQQQVAQ